MYGTIFKTERSIFFVKFGFLEALGSQEWEKLLSHWIFSLLEKPCHPKVYISISHFLVLHLIHLVSDKYQRAMGTKQ